MHVFGRWEEAGVPGEKPRIQHTNSAQKKATVRPDIHIYIYIYGAQTELELKAKVKSEF